MTLGIRATAREIVRVCGSGAKPHAKSVSISHTYSRKAAVYRSERIEPSNRLSSADQYIRSTVYDDVGRTAFHDEIAAPDSGNATDEDRRAANTNAATNVRSLTLDQRAAVNIACAPGRQAANQHSGSARTWPQRRAVAGEVANASSGRAHIS